MNKCTVGQVVAVRSGYGRNEASEGYTVTKVTPKGQVVVKRDVDGYEIRFDANGYEISKFASKYYRASLVCDIEAVREENRVHAVKIELTNVLNATRTDCRSDFSKKSYEDVVERMQQQIDAARALLAKI
jgi:hypothetical protein